MSLIRQYLNASEPSDVVLAPGVEDHTEEDLDIEVPEVAEVSDDEVAEAEDHIEEVEEERRERAVEEERREQMIEEAQTVAASVEDYIDVLSHGIESGQFSPQFAAIAGNDLKRYSAILGMEPNAVPAFEDFTHENLDQFYTDSLEGFKEVADKVKGIASKVGESMTMFTAGLAGNAKEAAALNTRADSLIGKLNQSDIKEVDVSLNKLGSVFSHDGKVPSNVIGALASDQKALKQIYDVVMVGNAKYYGESVAAMEKALSDKTNGKAAIDAFLSKNTPVGSIPSSTKTPTALLGAKVVSINKEDNSAKSVVNVLKKEQKLFESVNNASGTVTLNKAQVTGLLKAAKTYASMLSDLNKTAKTSLDIQTKLNKDLLQAARSDKVTPAKAVALAIFGGYFGIFYVIYKNSDNRKTEDELAIKQTIEVARKASKASKVGFEALSSQLSRNAKACLQLAERAMATKGKEAASDAE